MLRSQLIAQLQLALFIFHTVSASRIRFEDPDEPRKPFPDGNCVTPDNKTGRCARWTTCQSLRGITDLNLLQAYICGIDGKQLMVCCSLQPKDQTDSLSTTHAPRRLPKRLKSPRTKKTTKRRRFFKTTTESLPSPIRITASTPKSPTSDRQRSRKNDGDIKPSFLPDNCGTTFFTKSRVVGGQVAEKGGWPWMAIIFEKNKNDAPSLICGGSLVTDKYVITAAHCVVNKRGEIFVPLTDIIVALGVHDLRKKNESESVNIDVEEIRFHEEFDPHPRKMKHDIAVLRLRGNVQLSPYISPVCLPYDSLRYEDLADKTATVTGFGSISENGPMSPVLMETSVVIWDQEICERIYEKNYKITNSHLCAGSADGSRDACHGDSGSPLVAIGKEDRFYVVGIVSSGFGCARPGYPGIYTRVTTYLDWLAIHLSD